MQSDENRFYYWPSSKADATREFLKKKKTFDMEKLQLKFFFTILHFTLFFSSPSLSKKREGKLILITCTFILHFVGKFMRETFRLNKYNLTNILTYNNRKISNLNGFWKKNENLPILWKNCKKFKNTVIINIKEKKFEKLEKF